MTTEKPFDIKEYILKIAENAGVEKDKAIEIAEKCGDEVAMWRPYGGAISFTQIDDKRAADDYTMKVETETYALRGIIENITYNDEMSTDEKATAIAAAASDYRTRVNGLRVEENKSLWDKVRTLIVGDKKKIPYDSDPADEDEEDEDDKKKKPWKSSFKVFKDKDGNLRWLTFSSNAFEDLDKELFTTKALEEAVEHADKTGERGPLLIYHVPTAEIGHCDYQAVQGRFLMESGTFDDTPLGSKAAEYFANSDEERQVSIGFEYNSGDELDGVYEWLRIKERSVTPFGAAANPWTHFQLVGGKELDSRKREDLVKIFGEEMANEVISAADNATKELEGSTKYKETGENVDEKVKALYETVKKMPQDELRKELEAQLIELNGGKALEEEAVATADVTVVATSSGVSIDNPSEAIANLASLMSDISAKVTELATQNTAVQAELKELKKSDDEKIADAMKSKVAVIRPTEDDNNVVDEAMKIVDSLSDEDKNPARKYVDDLLKANRAG